MAHLLRHLGNRHACRQERGTIEVSKVMGAELDLGNPTDATKDRCVPSLNPTPRLRFVHGGGVQFSDGRRGDSRANVKETTNAN